MKVAVITRHAITNYGSLLQAIATQKVIEKIGHECKIINYIRDDESYSKHEITLLKRKPNWYNNLLKRYVYLVLRQPESILSGRKFEEYQKIYLKLTKKFTTKEQMKNDKPIADIYMTGSDQVWGPTEDGTYDSSYCLSFTDNRDKRIAYAASFGHTKMTEQLKVYYKKWLSRYKYISVREDSAIELLKNIDIQSKQVLDPTLLLRKTDWEEYIDKKINKKYILIYQIHNDPKLNKYAKKLAKEKNLSLIRISTAFHQIIRGGKFIWTPTIGTFLSYIKNTECLITDSFHGTAFAINFNINFIEVLPNNNTGTRNVSILKLTGLSDRILKDGNDISLIDKKIDYYMVNKILDEKRKESIDILKYMIEN